MAEGKNNILYAEMLDTDGVTWSAGLLDQMGSDCFRASSIS